VSATSLLEWWDGRMAAAALTAAAATPALLAAIDQHGAAVRDALLVDVALDPVSAMESLIMGAAGLVVAPPLIHLAAYLRGVLDQAHTDGWHPPETVHEHTCSDWVALRVTAICALARAHSMHAQPDPTA
jgi:hypothetical protein